MLGGGTLSIPRYPPPPHQHLIHQNPFILLDRERHWELKCLALENNTNLDLWPRLQHNNPKVTAFNWWERYFYLNWIREMVSFELSKRNKEGFFFILSPAWDIEKKKTESPWGIEPQTFRFCAPMCYHWATETLWQAKPNMMFIHNMHPYIPLWSVMLIYKHCSAESEGLRFDSSGGLRIFSLSHAWDKMKNIFLYF